MAELSRTERDALPGRTCQLEAGKLWSADETTVDAKADAVLKRS